MFAYGQTGSGKSYSVVGYGANRGIVPMVCEEIFNKVESDKQSGIQYEVMFKALNFIDFFSYFNYDFFIR